MHPVHYAENMVKDLINAEGGASLYVVKGEPNAFQHRALLLTAAS